MPTVIHSRAVWKLFDAFMLLGTLNLGICYVWARHLGHVGAFCDISDLVVNLPERILFRVNFSFVGAFLALLTFPIHAMTSSRVGGCMPHAAAFFQFLSGLGVILVGSCGPEEIMAVHILAAVLGFGGSCVAQILYNFVFYTEDKETMPDDAGKIFKTRCTISALFLIAFAFFGMGEAGILPEPTEHIAEWCLWFTLLAWYWTFKMDLQTFYVGAVDEVEKESQRQLLLPMVMR
jgi:hypothetical protein